MLSPTATGIVHEFASRTCPATSSAGSGSSNQKMSRSRNSVRAADRLRAGQRLVRVDHEVEIGADRLAHRAEPGKVVVRVRQPDLDLRTGQASISARQCLGHELGGRQVQPAALGVIDRHGRRGAPRELPERDAAATRAGIHTAVSIAASASDVIGPTVVARVELKAAYQTASGDPCRVRPTSRRGGRLAASSTAGRRCRSCSCTRVRSAPSAVVSSTNSVSCFRNAWTASVRLVSTARSTSQASAETIMVSRVIGVAWLLMRVPWSALRSIDRTDPAAMTCPSTERRPGLGGPGLRHRHRLPIGIDTGWRHDLRRHPRCAAQPTTYETASMRTTSPDVFTRRIVCSSFFSFALVNTGCWVSRPGPCRSTVSMSLRSR